MVFRGLRVDLSACSATTEVLPAETRRAVLGGRGLGVHLLLSQRAYEVDPLAPENPLVFAIGPLAGTAAPSAARYTLASRSPLTGTVFDGNSGGGFGLALRRLDLDYIVVTGSCPRPSYLYVGEGGVRLLPADSLWGLDVPDTVGRFSEVYDGYEAALIGPAGERGVLFASVSSKHGRQVGRGGLGAVMGSKRLKAVILDPADKVPGIRPDDERLHSVLGEASAVLKNSPVTGNALPAFGTAILLNVLNEIGALPTRNFRESRFESAEQISGEALHADWAEKRVACEGCSVGCTQHTRSRRGTTRGPEYESLWALGADCGVADLEAIIEANDACNRFGLDTITMGATIACAMELTEEGVLAGGPHFGDAAALLGLVADTGLRRGLGDELAEGSRRFAARYGRPELAMQVKDLELPAFDPRGMTGQGLAFATSNRGGCHLRANMLGPEVLGVPVLLDRFAIQGKADPLIHLQNMNAVLDSLPICKFAAYVLSEDHYSRMLSAVTGESVSPQELMQTGERIWNLERLFNLRAGFTRADDTLPRRLLCEPILEGPSRGRTMNLRPMLDEYYAHRGWDAAGVPGPAKLSELGIESPLGEVPCPVGPPISLGPEDVGEGHCGPEDPHHLRASHGG